MKALVYGRMLLKIVIIFNVLFIACAVVIAVSTGKPITWSWLAAQFPELFLCASACGALTYIGFRVGTISIRYENRSDMADKLLDVVKSLRYDLDREEPSWSIFKVKSKTRRIFPGFEDTLLIHQGASAFEVTAYREDARVIERMLDDKG